MDDDADANVILSEPLPEVLTVSLSEASTNSYHATTL